MIYGRKTRADQNFGELGLWSYRISIMKRIEAFDLVIGSDSGV
jgi:hypothetical protein